MSNNRIQVTLAFNADTKVAKQEMQSLQNQLTQTINNVPRLNSLGLTSQLQQAQHSAVSLKIALQEATNVNTGKLNLNKFRDSINMAGLDIKQIGQQMARLGPQGVEAFNQVAQAIASADTRVFSLNEGMRRLVNTFTNTVRYQASSMAIQAVTSSISEAISYTKELDKSLTNIRIVTGKSAEDMAKFTKVANQAAKNLSTSTKTYADASLIYFQQGLDAKEVAERAEVTIKLANAVGENAATVSEWMTAIWNNFDDGSQSLEYYADVLAKLGAATASSADEIAGGLTKFASVADTIGLSYEYAASMLATITAETRQSEGVVGTALKAILSRMQGLSLGETLEDGTDLNKYSQSLAAIGVDIKDATGNLKDANTVLDETAMRWKILSKDQQVALAQSVAGVRQYSQFIAMMDTWDKTQQNVQLSMNSSGALDTMQATFDDSIEGAQKRMRTSAEALYDSLLNEEFLKEFYDNMANIIDFVESLTKSLGGIPTILGMIASALTKVYQPQIATFFRQGAMAITDFRSSVDNFVHKRGFVSSYQQKVKQDAIEQAQINEVNSSGGFYSGQISGKMAEVRSNMVLQESKLTDTEKQRLDFELQILEARKQELRAMEQATDELKDQNLAIEGRVNQGRENKKQIDTTFLSTQGERIGQLQSIAKNIRSLGASGLAKDPNSQVDMRLDNAKEKASKLVNDIGIDFNVDEAFEKAVQDSKGDIHQATSILATQILKEAEAAIKQVSEQAVKGTVNGQQNTINQVMGMREGASYNTQVNTLYGFSQSVLAEGSGASSEQQTQAKNIKNITKNAINTKSSLKARQKELEAVKKLDKTADGYEKKLQAAEAAVEAANKEHQEAVKLLKEAVVQAKNLAKELNQGGNGIDLPTEDLDAFNDDLEASGDAVEEFTRNSVQIGEAEENIRKDTDNLSDSVDELNNSFGDQRPKSWSEILSNGLSNITTVATGVMMLSSAVATLTEKLMLGTASWQDWTTGLMSALPGAMQIAKPVYEMVKAIGMKIAASKAATAADDTNTAKEIANSGKRQAASIAEAAIGVSTNVAKGPAFWPAAIAGVAAMAAVGVAIALPALNTSAKVKEQKEEELRTEQATKAQENLELISTTSDLGNTVNDLTEEYERLSESGQSAYETLEQMREHIPDLIEKYKELALALQGLDISEVEELERLYQQALVTGDWSAFTDKQQEIESKVNEEKIIQAQKVLQNPESGSTATQNKITETFSTGDNLVQVNPNFANSLNEAIYYSSLQGTDVSEFSTLSGAQSALATVQNNQKTNKKVINTWITDVEKALKGINESAFNDKEALEALQEVKFWLAEYKETYSFNSFEHLQIALSDLIKHSKKIVDLSSLTTDLPTVSEAAHTYQYDRAMEGWLTDTAIPTITQANYENNKVAADAVTSNWNIDKEVTVTGQDNIAKVLNNPILNAKATNYADYLDKRVQLIADLQAYWAGQGLPIDEEGARGIIMKSPLAVFEQQYQLWGNSKSIFAGKVSDQDNRDDMAQWMMQLSPEDQVVAQTIDWTDDQVADRNDILSQQKKIKAKQMARNKANTDFETSAREFDLYYEKLKQLNPELENNEEALAELTYQSVRFRKTMEEFADSWDDIWEKINSDDIGDQAEGLNQFGATLEETYGIVLNNEEDLRQAAAYTNEFLSGNFKNYNEFLRLMAMSYYTSIDEDTKKILGEQGIEISNWLSNLQFDDIPVGVAITADTAQFNAVYQRLVELINRMSAEAATAVKTMLSYAGLKLDFSVGKDGEAVFTSITRVASTNSISNLVSGLRRSSGGSKKEKKNKTDEIERYHEIKEVLSDLERQYDQLGSAADRAFGQAKIDYLDRQIEKQKELIDNQEIYLGQIREQLGLDKQALAKYGASFDEYGRITNYNELMSVNIDAYNKRLSDEGEKAYEEFVKVLQQYEETLNLYEDEAVKQINQKYELLNKKLEQVTIKVEVQLELSEDDSQWIDYQIERLGDTAIDAAKKLLLLSSGLKTATTNIDTYQQGLQDILKTSDFSSDEIATILAGGDPTAIVQNKTLTEEQINTLRQYRDGLYDSMKSAEEYRDQVVESLTTAFEDLNEEMNKGVETVSHFQDMVSGYRDIVDLVGAETLGVDTELLEKMDRASVSMANNAISIAKTILDTRQRELVAAQEALDKAIASGDQENIEIWQDQVDTITNSVREAEKELQSTWKAGLEAATQAFESEIERIQKSFEKAMAGIYGSFDALSTAFDRAQEVDDLFLDDYQKIYELSKLNRELMKSIDETDSVRAKNKLRDLQEEINDLQASNTEMTQHEVDSLQAKYQLRLAEIALEEAQNAKTQVRMQRDSEGNWGYVYTADANAIASAEQNYEDKLYQYQQQTQEYVQQTQEQIMQIPQALSEALGEIMRNTTLTEEERQLRIAETIEHYKLLYNHWTEQLNLSTEEAKRIYDIDWAQYSQTTGYKISADEAWIDSWNETTYAQLTGLTSMDLAQKTFVSNTERMEADLNRAWKQWQYDVDSACKEAGSSIQDFQAHIEPYLNQVSSQSYDTAQEILGIGQAGATAFQNLANSASSWLGTYASTMAQYRAQAEQTIASINALIAAQSQVSGESPTSPSGTSFQGNPQAGSVSGTTGNDSDKEIVDDATTSITGYTRPRLNTVRGTLNLTNKEISALKLKENDNTGTFYFEYGDSTYHVDSSIAKDLVTKGAQYDYIKVSNLLQPQQEQLKIPSSVGYIFTVQKANKDYYLSEYGEYLYPISESDAKQLKAIGAKTIGFDTGGYTGRWDSSGRLAMLHQKEIVLNAHDTENFLAGIKILREITQAIDLQALAQNRFLSAIQATKVNTNNQTIEQNITVHAEFPEATNRDEIREAILGLSNYASQFANRKK